MAGNNYILIIAIDKYKDKAFPVLNNAKLDAARLQTVLENKYGFDIIQEPLLDSFADRANIINALNNLTSFLTANDNLIIYFAGHGRIHTKTETGYWVPFDGTHNSTHNYVSNSDVINTIKGIDAKHVLIISDSCFSGTFLSQTRSVDIDKHYAKLDERKSRWILASGREETVSDGEPGLGSPFTNALINFLETNKNKRFSFLELAVKVRQDTGSSVKQEPVFGQLTSFRHNGGEMVFKLELRNEESRGGWEANFQKFCGYKETRPEWPYISKENPETKSIGLWCMDQRTLKREGRLNPDREQRLHDAGFIFNPNVQKFFIGLGKFLAFMHNTGFDYIPNHLRKKYNEEYAWLRVQQKTYKKNPCDPNNPKSYPRYRYEILKKNGIEIHTKNSEDTWPLFKENLVKFYETHPKFLTIPSQKAKDKNIADLGNKLNDYMENWKKVRLADDKINFLQEYVDKDYKLNKDKRALGEWIKKLHVFQNGDRTKIPRQGKDNGTGLGNWYAGIMTASKPGKSKSLPAWKAERLREEKIIK